MKTIQVAIISFVALALSGCATGYYQRGYVGYNTGYSSPSYYQSYDRSYYSPGTSVTYGRYYVQPSYRPQHHHDGHHDWRSPVPHFDRHEAGHGGWAGREFRSGGHHAEQAPRHEHERSRSAWQGRGFEGHRGDSDDGHARGGWRGGRHGQ